MKKKSLIIALAAISFVGLSFVANNGDHNRYFEIAKNIEIFTNLYKEINNYYVDDIEPAKLMRTGVDAMLESLDPYTNYISESEIEGFRYMTTGKYGGIGATITVLNDRPTVTEVYEGYSANEGGLKVGDIITEVDAKSTKGKNSDDLSDILKGTPGTKVVLTVERPGQPKDLKVTLARSEVKVPNVPYSGMVNENIGYISLTTFTQNAGKNVEDALKELENTNKNLKGIILDLRGNGGGLLNEAINVSNVFVDKGEQAVVTRGKVPEWDRSFKTLNLPVDVKIPLVVIIDHNSASASEIVAGVIQDLDRGVLLGQRSYGKGLVQNTRDVGYNSKVKLTTAKYYIPSGRCIQAVQYKNGEPVNIPDEQRTPFKTRSGRSVLDGGGVKPDVLLNDEDFVNVLRSLEKENIIFDYATDFVLKNPTIAKSTDFHFVNFPDFMDFVAKKGFKFETDSEKLLNQLDETASKEDYAESIKADIKSIKNKIITSKKNDLQKHKDEIIRRIEKEIVSRYYYRKGAIQIGLRNDREIKEAIAVLNDAPRYESLLKK
jgi:carboxyl-terminal processing protease